MNDLQPRARRRHERTRQIARALRSCRYQDMPPDERERFAVRTHDHLAVCSCWMCGNPRRYEGELTVQERRRKWDDLRTASWKQDGA